MFNARVFPRPRLSAWHQGPRAGLESVPGRDGARHPVRARRRRAGKRVLIYVHGNAEDIGSAAVDRLEAAFPTWDVLAVEYPGYGIAPGEPSAESIYGALVAVVEHEHKVLGRAPGDMVLCGFSLGTGPCLRLATEHPLGPGIHGLLLIASFTTIRDVVLSHYPALDNVRCVLPVVYDNLSAARGLRCARVALLHNEGDPSVPYCHSVRLAEAIGAHAQLFSDSRQGHGMDATWLQQTARDHLNTLFDS